MSSGDEMHTITNDWSLLLEQERQKDYFKKLELFLDEEYKQQTIYPCEENLFQAFELTSYADTRVVIIGQDPYHGPNQAHGLCFSVNKGVKIPPSLRNIYKTLAIDCGCSIPAHGYLTKWAKQGVLMINAVLTVRAGQAGSHTKKGWETFTDQVISYLNKKDQPMVFLLWGNHAQKKADLITNPNHLILKSVHPSPLSARRGFFECGHFSATNAFLKEHYKQIIDWQIED